VAEREKQSPAYALFVGWLEGYVTHFNKVTTDTTDVFAWQTTELATFLLNNYCKANPKTRFDVAVETMVKSLYPTRLRNVSEVVDVPGSQPPLQVYKDVVRRIQQTLTERGFYKGSIDGDYGPATVKAMKAFQVSEKRDPTGLPDQVSLLLLFQ
ncbi:MAG: peptidoglycan-binding protein, partial [Alphaproteobacteria bacterium]